MPNPGNELQSGTIAYSRVPLWMTTRGERTSRVRLSSQCPHWTRSGRTSTASTRMPTTRANPSWRSEPSGLNKNYAKLLAVMMAAELIKPPVWPMARTIPSRSPRRCDSSLSLVIRKTL